MTLGVNSGSDWEVDHRTLGKCYINGDHLPFKVRVCKYMYKRVTI